MRGRIPGLRTRLLGLVLIAMIPGIGLAVYRGAEERQHIVLNTQADLLRLAHAAAGAHEREIDEAQRLLEVLARLPEVRRRDAAACGAIFAQIVEERSDIANLMAAGPDGGVFCNGFSTDGPLSVADRGFFQQALDTGGFALGEYRRRRAPDTFSVGVAQPILGADARPNGSVLAALNLDWLTLSLSEGDLPPGWTITVVDQGATVLARVPDPEPWVGRVLPEAPLVQAILARHEGVVEVTGLDGIPRLYAFTPLSQRPAGDEAYVSVGIPLEAALAPAERALAGGLGLLLVTSLLALGAAWVRADQVILRPVRSLVRATDRLRAGDLGARSGLPHVDGEFGQLGRAFDEMAGVLEAREAQRLRADERVRLLAASSEQPARSIDYDTTLRTVAGLAVPHLADWCAVDILENNSTIRRVSLAHTSETRESWMPELQRTYRLDPAASRGVSAVLRTGRPELYPEISDDMLRANAADAKQLRLLRGFGLRSAMVVPLMARSRPLGVLILVTSESDRRYVADDLVLAEELAQQAALAIDNARLYYQTQLALADLERTQRQVIRQERMHAMGQMTSGIAHDFNNALGIVVGYSEVLLANPDGLADVAQVRSHLEEIAAAAQDAAGVVRRLREFYRFRSEHEPLQAVDLRDVVARAISLAQPRWKDQARAQGAAIRIETDLDDPPPVAGNPTELGEALTNLVINAVDAMPSGGTLSVQLRAVDDQVILEVRDTGIGMTPEVREHLFEPFFTTKGDGGTGLGLAMVYGIVQRHSGTVSVDSAPGRGATFTICFPALTGPAVDGQPAHISDGSPHSLRVLLVDDEPSLRRVLSKYLELDGHRVTVAESGQAALELFRPDAFDLIITDRSMPRLSGDQLATAIKQQAPDAPVIMLTGFGEIMLAASDLPAGVDLLIAKPVTLAAMRQAVLQIIQAPEWDAS